MKFAALIARYLLGIIFVVFGANGFLHFLPSPPIPGQAGQYFGLLMSTHYLILVFALEIVAGLLLLVNKFVPLALVMLGPILVNILMFHTLMQPAGLPPGVLATVLWIVVFLRVRPAFDEILKPSGAEAYASLNR